MADKTFHITGRVIDKNTKAGIQGMHVQAWDKDLIFDDLVGSAETDQNGQFEIYFSTAHFRGFFERRPDLFFKVYRDRGLQQLIASTEDSVLWNVRQAEIPVMIEVDMLPDGSAQFVVSGTVRHANGRALSGLTVHVYEVDLRQENLLGECLTDESGYYLVAVDQPPFLARGNPSPNLLVRVFAPATGPDSGEMLAESHVMFNARPLEKIDLRVVKRAYQGPSEYEQVLARIAPELGNVEVAELKEDDQFKDISFLAGKTGVASRRLHELSWAARLAQKTELPAEVFYAFFRNNLPADLPSLLAESSQLQRQVLQSAIDNNLIPTGFTGQLEDILARLEELAADESGQVLTKTSFLYQPEVLYSSLATSQLQDEQRTFLAARLNRHLHREIVRRLGVVSREMAAVLQAVVARIDHQKDPDRDLDTVIEENVLAEIQRDPKLAAEAGKLGRRLAEKPPVTLRQALHLDTPIRDNPILAADLRAGRTYAYADAIGLGSTVARQLVNRSLNLEDASDSQLDDLVQDGLLTGQQKADLRLVIDLGRLTGDNLKFVTGLKEQGAASTRDFIGWQKNDWQTRIESGDVPLPPGETAETYAEHLLLNIERTYPTQVLFHRLLESASGKQIPVLDSLNELLQDHRRLIDGRSPAAIHWDRVEADRRQPMQRGLQNLSAFANRFRHLEVAEVINDRAMPLAEKKAALTSRLQSLETFAQSNPDLDLRGIDFFAEDDQMDWNGIAPEDRPLLRKQLMGYQRALSVTDAVSETETLLSNGYDSAVQVGNETESKFVEGSGLSRGAARKIFAISQQKSQSIAQGYLAVHDAVWGVNLGRLPHEKPDPQLVNDLRDIDGFSDLFGPQDYCGCDHWRSIVSPSAYFVDLMYWIETHILEHAFKDSPEHNIHLKNRRPDLWTLLLNEENTNNLVPYLTIVNEVLEAYLKTTIFGGVWQNLADPELKTSFVVPFNLPLEELRLYLSHFGISVHRIYTLLKQPEQKVQRARLNLSQGEFDVIATPDPEHVNSRFGSHASFDDFDVQEFIRLAGISRTNLDELLAQTFLDLHAVKVEKQSAPDEFQNFPEILGGLTAQHADRIHRFIRLWRKTSWSIPDLDLVLTALKNAEVIGSEETNPLDGNAVCFLAHLVDLQERLNLTVEELCSIFHLIPASSSYPLPPSLDAHKRLFERLFDVPKLLGDDGTTTFFHQAFSNAESTTSTVDPQTPLLLAGLGVSESDFLVLLRLLAGELGFDQAGTCTLDRAKLSLLYRHARLARVLKLDLPDFVQALRLLLPHPSVLMDIGQIEEACDFADWLTTCPLSVQELRFVLTGEESISLRYKSTLQAAEALLAEVGKETGLERLDALKRHLATAIDLPRSELNDLLGQHPGGLSREVPGWIATHIEEVFPPDMPPDALRLHNVMKDLERIRLLFARLEFSAETIQYLTGNFARLGIQDPEQVGLADVKALCIYRSLIFVSDDAESTVTEILSGYNAQTPHQSAPALARLWQQDASLIASLIDGWDLPVIALQALTQIRKNLDVCNTLGISGHSLLKLGNDGSYGEIAEARDVALGAFRSRYQDEALLRGKLEPYQDRINVMKRDAMCGYILGRKNVLRFKDTADLYAFFLLDVEMSGCAKSSRLVSAISSLQLYVHRVLANLEQSESDPPLVVPDRIREEAPEDWDSFHAEWEWRKNYRVWEANRKIFLYSENYVEPGLREDKTHLFKDLEDELLQQKIGKQSAEEAYRKYLAQLSELAQLRIVGSYYDVDEQYLDHPLWGVYYFFGRTHTLPFQYYYRTYASFGGGWGNWTKMDLAIEADEVSAIVLRGRLYVFWTVVQRKEINKVVQGNSVSDGYVFSVYVKYAFLDEQGKWSASQQAYVGFLRVSDDTIEQRLGTELTDDNRDAMLERFQEEVFWKPYPSHPTRTGASSAVAVDLHFLWSNKEETQAEDEAEPVRGIYRTAALNWEIEYETSVPGFEDGGTWVTVIVKVEIKLGAREFTASSTPFTKTVQYQRRVKVGGASWSDWFELSGDLVIDTGPTCKLEAVYESGRPPIPIFVSVAYTPEDPGTDESPAGWMSSHKLSLATNTVDTATQEDLSTSSESLGDFQPEYDARFAQIEYRRYVQDGTTSFANKGWTITRDAFDVYRLRWGGTWRLVLSTVAMDRFCLPIFSGGLDAFLSIETQEFIDHDRGIEVDFGRFSPYGIYFRELFFHIPYLIASHLNAEQRFADAKWWYERIFNPTATNCWGYLPFQQSEVETMEDVITNEPAIEAYRADPFDPHAIAQLRLWAYPKAIVTKYLDNLLDWGDSLFAQDTRESINEATMLYTLAADILGRRPALLGPCQTACDSDRDYETIGPKLSDCSDFQLALENWALVTTLQHAGGEAAYFPVMARPPRLGNPALSLTRPPLLMSSPRRTCGVGTRAASSGLQVARYGDVKQWHESHERELRLFEVAEPVSVAPATWVVAHLVARCLDDGKALFCVPPNDDLLAYWDRVEDRLFKIRFCMNINGIHRQLALFQPAIEPMLLVRAKAAGLSLEEALQTTAQLPAYRFSYLIEKAKAFTQTVQAFGSALLSALEKKDVEELTLLRSVQERNISRLTKAIKKQQVVDAEHQLQAVEETIMNIDNRVHYYRGLIRQGLIDWETAQQHATHTATTREILANTQKLLGAILYLLPQVGSPFAWKYGGLELGNNAQAIGATLSSLASISHSIATSAAIEATFQRREQDWKYQLSHAMQESKTVEQQRLAAEIRCAIAENDLAVHESNMRQSDELDEFYRSKFTKLGLYDYLATTLNRLYRQAYKTAEEMAKAAQKAYQFERDDKATFFIASDNWQYNRAGLLAGERLLLQLQQMENAYLEQNVRDQEITQSFSLALLDSSQLLSLRENGTCVIDLPEIAFDLSYPGQYKRLIKSVRLSIPCVVGPYTNVSAKLTLISSQVRTAPALGPQLLEDWVWQKDTCISASSAQNDAGLFDFNFRDERYLPFEGAGAISQWKLQLPGQFRTFDYGTIADVIVHVSYTAKGDDTFRETVETSLSAALTDYAETDGLWRLLSLKHEFGDALPRLLRTSGIPASAELNVTRGHFPHFLSDLRLSLTEMRLYLRPKRGEQIETSQLTLSIVGTGRDDATWSGECTAWNPFDGQHASHGPMWEAHVQGAGDPDPVKRWTITVTDGQLTKDTLDDILVLIKYKTVTLA
jgi:hypothetical protein